MNVTSHKKSAKELGLFSLVMIAIVSVDSLRNLPIAAQYGFSLISYYLLAGLLFFLPLAWVTGRLVQRYPLTGGSYVWITEAFGPSYGYIGIFLQWLYNIIWYPTLFAFLSVTLASLIAPNLETNKWFILAASLGFFWLLSLIHCCGIRASSWISGGSAILGTLLPMTLIIILAGYWLFSGKSSATPLSWEALLPKAVDLQDIGFFSNILFSLLGLEVIAMHAGNVHNPRKAYPRALSISSIVILLTIICSSSALCIIMPAQQIALVSGLMDVLKIFFQAYSINNLTVIIGVCIIIGGIGIASSWMIGLARGLHVALCETNSAPWMQVLNKNKVPTRVLLVQSLVYSVLASCFLLFPNINNAYWFLSATTAQFALLYYVILFGAAIKLLTRWQQSSISNFLNFLIPGMAIMICLFGILVGFVPPESFKAEGSLKYVSSQIVAFAAMFLFFVFWCYRFKRKSLV